MSTDRGTRRSFAEYVRQQHERDLSYSLADAVEEAVRHGNRRLVTDEYGAVAEVTAFLCDALLSTASPRELFEQAGDADGEAFDAGSLRWFQSHQDRLLATAANNPEQLTAASRRITAAFESAAALAESQEIVVDEVESRVPVMGWSKQIGEHLQDAEMDLGETVRGVSEQAGALKTLHLGGTGMGKSNGLACEADDYLQRTFDEGRSFKLIDLVDLRDGDTWYYDIPQQQDVLRRVREDQDLPPDFAAGDEYGQADLEVLMPLTPGLSAEDLPYDTDDESFRVQPFTIPACELRKPLLVSMIMSRLSDQEEQTVRQAYDDVNRTTADWSLADLADEIKSKDELSMKHKKKAVGVIQTLQNEGFIRTKESQHTIDWDEIFGSAETVTAFSQVHCSSVIGRLMCIAYLTYSVVEERSTRYDVPECVVMMRELWKVAPHNRRQHYDDRAAAIQETIGKILGQLFRENRHSGVHVLADTQQPSDLLKPVREMFNRYVVYSANKDTLKDIFSWTSNDMVDKFWRTMTAKRGQAGIVGQVQPAIDERDIEFVSPVEYAAPSYHHPDAKTDRNGWQARSKYLTPTTGCPECGEAVERDENGIVVRCRAEECGEETIDPSLGREETLRQPHDVAGVHWPDEIPESLKINGVDESKGPDIDMAPVAAFAAECLEIEKHETTVKNHIYSAFNAFLEENARELWDFDTAGVKTRFGSRLVDAIDEIDTIQTTERKGGVCYRHIVLNDKGERYFKSVQAGEATGMQAAGD